MYGNQMESHCHSLKSQIDYNVYCGICMVNVELHLVHVQCMVPLSLIYVFHVVQCHVDCHFRIGNTRLICDTVILAC